jgi:hypothetical protein
MKWSEVRDPAVVEVPLFFTKIVPALRNTKKERTTLFRMVLSIFLFGK